MDIKLEPYVCVSGTPYTCDVNDCKKIAKWKAVITPQKTMLVCDNHTYVPVFHQELTVDEVSNVIRRK